MNGSWIFLNFNKSKIAAKAMATTEQSASRILFKLKVELNMTTDSAVKIDWNRVGSV